MNQDLRYIIVYKCIMHFYVNYNSYKSRITGLLRSRI